MIPNFKKNLPTILLSLFILPSQANASFIDLDLSSIGSGFSFGSNALTYDVAMSGTTALGTSTGDFSGKGGSTLTITFSSAVDFLITPPDTVAPWNDDADLNLSLTGNAGSTITITEPDSEMGNITGSGTNSVSWDFVQPETSLDRFPSNQDWAISLTDITALTFLNSTTTGSTAILNLQADDVVAPVPVPSAVWLFGSSLIGFAGLKRRAKNI